MRLPTEALLCHAVALCEGWAKVGAIAKSPIWANLAPEGAGNPPRKRGFWKYLLFDKTHTKIDNTLFLYQPDYVLCCRENLMLFLVIVNTAVPEGYHGGCTPVLITGDLARAIRVARSAETLGYVLNETTEFAVYQVEMDPEKGISADSYKYAGTPPDGYPCVMSILLSHGHRFEAWSDQKLRAQFEE